MKAGSIVLPKKQTGSVNKVYLTPISVKDVEDLEEWIEWDLKELGIIVEMIYNHQVVVMVPSGIGCCFEDELFEAL